MADLNINNAERSRAWEDCGNYSVPNISFETVPSFVAATNISGRWIDGTAAGSTTNSIYGWGIFNITGSGTTQFDTSTSNSGSASMKASTTATGSKIILDVWNSGTVANNNIYGIAISPSTSYTCSYWMKTNFTSGDSSDGASINFVTRNSSVTGLTNNIPSKVKTTTNWTQYSITFTSGSTAVFLSPQMQVVGNTGTATLIMDAWFDDIIIAKTAPTTGAYESFNAVVTSGIQTISGPKIWS